MSGEVAAGHRPGAQTRGRYAEMLDATPDFVGTADARGNTLSINPAGRRMLGVGGDEDLSGTHISRYHPGWAREVILEEGIPAAVRDGAWEGETALLSRDGREVPVSQVIIAHRGDDGAVEYLSTVARDLTERKAAEEQRAYHAHLLENLSDAVVATDGRFVVTAWNRGAEEMYGWTAGEALGRSVGELIRPDVTGAGLEEDSRELAGKDRVRRDLITHRKDGAPVHTEGVTVALRGERGRVTGYLGINRDVTGRKRVEGALREAEAFARSVLDSLSAHIAVLDGAGVIVATNKAWREFAASNGAPADAGVAEGANYLEVCDGARGENSEGAAAFAAGVRSVASGRRETFELEYPCHSPTEKRWFVGRVTRFPGARPTRVVVAHENVTQRRRAEEDLRTRARQQRAVADLGRRALSVDASTLMEDAVTVVAETLGVRYCKVLELLPGGDELLLRAGVGWRAGLAGRATVGADRDSQAGYTLLSDGPVVVEDLRTERRFSGPPLLREHGVVSGMSTVIRGREEPFGVIGAHHTEARAFTDYDVHFLRAVANVLAAAVERERAEGVLHDVREAERRRMARDLHDGALQGITYALAEVQLVQAIWENPGASGRLGKADGRLEKAADALLRAGRELREAVYDLHQADTRGKPFAEVLEDTLATTRRMAPELEIELSMGAGFTDKLPDAAGRELLRILQEAITNARRHSQARRVRVALEAGADGIRAEVADDGRGFEPGTAAGGLGRTSMLERAQALGGTLHVESAPGRGTRVLFRMPGVQ